MNKKRICLLGGSFDPVHRGHIMIAEKAIKRLNMDKIIFLPCAQSPLKDAKTHASDVQRLTMIEKATEDMRGQVELSDYDLRLPPPSWSWRVADHFKQIYPEDELFWLMGTDQWNDLEKWGRWEYLAELMQFIVYKRGDAPLVKRSFAPHILQGDHPASSSRIREDIHDPDIQEWLHPHVLSYIKEHKLYH